MASVVFATSPDPVLAQSLDPMSPLTWRQEQLWIPKMEQSRCMLELKILQWSRVIAVQTFDYIQLKHSQINNEQGQVQYCVPN